MIKTVKRGSIDIVTLAEQNLNALTVDVFREETIKLVSENHSKVILDLSGVKYIDSTGFGALLTILRTAKNNYGSFKLCCAESQLRRMFAMLHLDTVFEIHENLEDCIRSFS